MKITQVLLVEQNRMELVDKDVPSLLNSDVLVEVIACGICSSENPVYQGKTQNVPGVSFRYSKFPCFMGHEIVGIVTDVGKDVKCLKPGDRVTGVAYRESGFATHIIDSHEVFVKVPLNIPLEYALGEPLMAAVNIVRMSEPDFGDFIFICGDGFMALLTIVCLQLYPLKSVVVSGHHDERLKIAKNLGASIAINALHEDPYWIIREHLDGQHHDSQNTRWLGGVDIAFEFAGAMSALQLCASLCKPKKRAKLMMPSFYGTDPFSIGHYLMNRAPTLIACHPAHSRNINDDLRRAMWALENGIFPMEKLITHVFRLDQVAEAIEMGIDRGDGYIKGIVVPDPAKLESDLSTK